MVLVYVKALDGVLGKGMLHLFLSLWFVLIVYIFDCFKEMFLLHF